MNSRALEKKIIRHFAPSTFLSIYSGVMVVVNQFRRNGDQVL